MPHSRREVRYARAVMGGKARKKGMSKEAATEIVAKMHGRRMSELPERAPKRARRVR